jgi:type II secretory pathway pseudopilin PulG
MTLIELMIVVGILATVILALTSILLSTSRVQSRTVRRAGSSRGRCGAPASRPIPDRPFRS